MPGRVGRHVVGACRWDLPQVSIGRCVGRHRTEPRESDLGKEIPHRRAEADGQLVATRDDAGDVAALAGLVRARADHFLQVMVERAPHGRLERALDRILERLRRHTEAGGGREAKAGSDRERVGPAVRGARRQHLSDLRCQRHPRRRRPAECVRRCLQLHRQARRRLRRDRVTAQLRGRQTPPTSDPHANTACGSSPFARTSYAPDHLLRD
jgi:hypothetical protein